MILTISEKNFTTEITEKIKYSIINTEYSIFKYNDKAKYKTLKKRCGPLRLLNLGRFNPGKSTVKDPVLRDRRIPINRGWMTLKLCYNNKVFTKIALYGLTGQIKILYA